MDRTRLRSLVAPAVVAALAGAVVAQKPGEIVRLASGRAHEVRRASPVADGWTVTTALGDVAVLKKEVVGVEPAAAAHARLAPATDGLHPANTAGQFAAASLAASKGLWTEARARLEAVLALDPDHAGARALAASWADAFRLNPWESEQGSGARKAVEDWFELRASDWVGAAMAVRKAEGRGSDLLLRPALKAFKSEKPSARWAAAQILAALKFDSERIKPLYRASLVDRSAPVRRESVRALRATNDAVFARLFARNLAHPSQEVRMTAGEALGELGMKDAIEPLLAAAAGDPPRPPRSHVAVTNQVAYVKDYDVEVAQGAVIADPIVDVVQEGAILDVGIVAINIERHVYYTALRRITGLRLGDDLNAWRSAAAK